MIGDIALLSNQVKRTASCIAVTHVEVYKISRPSLLEVLSTEQLELLQDVARAKVAMTHSAAKVCLFYLHLQSV